MDISEIRCTNCFAPVDPSRGSTQRCPYCGTTLVLGGALPLGGTLRLEEIGPNIIQVIKVVREITGLGLKEAKDLVERAPCVLAESLDGARMERFRGELEAAGARVSGGGVVTPHFQVGPVGCVFLEDGGPNKIGAIKVVREHTGLGLKEAKDLVESAPCEVEGRVRRPTSLRDDLIAIGARVR